MSKNQVTGIVVGAVVAVIVLMGVSMGISTSNKEIGLVVKADAVQKSNEARYDEVWKTIKQVAGVTDKYSKDFKEVYLGMMEGRYGGEKGSPMLKFVTESNPTLDPAMYTKLTDTIIAQRAGWTRDQKKLIDIKREHDALRQLFPSKLFVGGRPELEIVVVTSSKTKAVFASGEDNDIDLF
jgi:hypothetical protein